MHNRPLRSERGIPLTMRLAANSPSSDFRAMTMHLRRMNAREFNTPASRAILPRLRNRVKLWHTDASGAVMSLRKLLFYAMLAMITFAAAEMLNGRLKKSALHSCSNDPVHAGSFGAKNERLSADLLPVQSKNAKSLRAGKVLVASRELGDPHFVETVILLVQYDGQGVLGLILNRRTDIPISRALEGMKAAKDRSDPVYLGGPVETAAFALLQSPTKIKGAEPVFGGVYLITSKPLFEQTISARPDPGMFHVYMGYAGWTQEQLQKEVELGAWFIFPADVATVFNAHPDSLWQEMIRRTELQLARTEAGSLPPIAPCVL
jgi:putative AlgH/UPF0301 family transcriptional regulator